MTTIPTPYKPAGTARQGMGATSRSDNWTTEPLIVAFGFTTFVVYSLFSALLWGPLFGAGYEAQGYLSPFFSPLIRPDWLPFWFSPAILILWIPLGFRATCYYYRKAYYRSYFADPPACAVGEPVIHRRYALETAFPFILQNLHRFFLYLAFVPLFFLWIDALQSFRDGGAWRIGLGSVILTGNVILLSGYSLSCHSLRHLVGGMFDVLLRRPIRKTMYDCVSCMNRRHMLFAWMSLFWVAFSDLYIRMCSMGIWTDWRII